MRYTKFVTIFCRFVSNKRGDLAEERKRMGRREAGDMTCRNCGANLEAGSRFCNSCGAAVSRQPSREEVRARVQGSGRYAAPQAGRSGAPAAPQATLGAQHVPLLCLVVGLLAILQLVFLFINTLFVTLAAGQTDYGVVPYSMYGALRQVGSGWLGVLLLLLCLVLLGSIAIPMILWGRPRAIVTIGLSVLLLILFLVAFGRVSASFSENYLGAKPKLGFYGWMFLLNCLLIPGLAFLAGQMEDVDPAPAPARSAPAPAPRAAAQTAPRRPTANSPVRPAAPARNVTPPDAETIAALRRMAQMHKEGLVSDEEFARIKAECVARGWIRQ